MKEIKYQQKYVRQLAEGGTGTDVSFMRFNFPFGLELFAPCRQGLFFLRCFQKVDGYDRQSEDVVRITSNTLSPKGKEDFTESVLNTEAIRKQQFTFASSKRMAQTAMEAEAQQSGIGDYPHSTLGKSSFQIGIIILRPHGIALSLHRD